MGEIRYPALVPEVQIITPGIKTSGGGIRTARFLGHEPSEDDHTPLLRDASFSLKERLNPSKTIIPCSKFLSSHEKLYISS